MSPWQAMSPFKTSKSTVLLDPTTTTPPKWSLIWSILIAIIHIINIRWSILRLSHLQPRLVPIIKFSSPICKPLFEPTAPFSASEWIPFPPPPPLEWKMRRDFWEKIRPKVRPSQLKYSTSKRTRWVSLFDVTRPGQKEVGTTRYCKIMKLMLLMISFDRC